jgi:glutaredoxin
MSRNRAVAACRKLHRGVAAAALALAAVPAAAQYKVVAPDGSVTYTDRPPVAANVRVIPMGRSGAVQPSTEAVLPLELRQIAARFPVTLYTAADCAPCDAGRQLLQGRGVPFSERTVASDDDAAALDRLVGARSVPALTIGGQALRGLSQSEWTSYLDAAGYPRESRLPRGWTAAPPMPLVQRTPLPQAAQAPPAEAVPDLPDPLPVDPAPNAIRF